MHLSVCLCLSVCLSVSEEESLCIHMCRCRQELVSEKGRSQLRHLDQAEADYRAHLAEIDSKLVLIIGGACEAQLNKWEARPPVPSQQFRSASPSPANSSGQPARPQPVVQVSQPVPSQQFRSDSRPQPTVQASPPVPSQQFKSVRPSPANNPGQLSRPHPAIQVPRSVAKVIFSSVVGCRKTDEFPMKRCHNFRRRYQ